MEVLLEKRVNGKVGWNTLHIDDGHGWNIDKAPSLFDEDYEAKPAYYAVQEALENVPTGINDSPEDQPGAFQLHDNYPDPFHSTTSIAYTLPESAHVVINVYHITGHRITTLVNEEKAAGKYQVIWDARNSSNLSMPSGIYLYRIWAKNYTRTCKMMLLD